jgi:hypothetical protein
MIRIVALIGLSLFVAAAGLTARAQDVPAGVRIHGGYVSGNEYLDMSVQQREAYVAGLLLGMRLAPSFGAPADRLDWLNGCTTVLDRAALGQRIYDALFDDTKLWGNRNPAKMYRAVAAGCRAAAGGARTAPAAPFTVNNYVAMGGLEKKEFVSGLLEGMLLAPAFGGQESRMGWFLSCTATHDRLELRAKLNAFVMAHNELWPETSPAPYFRAIADACAAWANQRPQNSGR